MSQHIHVIGIGGIGISGLAQLLLNEGNTITGVNDSESPDTLDILRKQGVSISLDRSIDSIPDADYYIYSTAWDINEKEYMDAVRQKGKPTLHYFEALGKALKNKEVVAISGTNGKSTTTAMIAHGLVLAQKDPTVIVGSLMTFADGVRSNYRNGSQNSPVIVEACEYQRHFLELNPTVLVITNIEEDHLDYYKDIDDIVLAFRQLAEKVPPHGVIIYNGKDPHVQNVIKDLTVPMIDWSTTDFDEKLSIPGVHNNHNARAAVTVLEYFGVQHTNAVEYIASFKGIWRRSEFIRKNDFGALIFDDYGHHPTAIQQTIKGFKSFYPEKNINVIFQPHLFSRTKMLFDDFARSFVDAHKTYILPIYPAREKFDPTISSEMLVEKAFTYSPTVFFVATLNEAQDLIKQGEKDEVWITMGAGDVTTVGRI